MSAQVLAGRRVIDVATLAAGPWIAQRLGDFGADVIKVEQPGIGEGKLCLHPDQVTIANQVFTPTAAEVSEAHRVLKAFEDAVAAGSASIQLDGRFIDHPIAERARRVIETRESTFVEEAAR